MQAVVAVVEYLVEPLVAQVVAVLAQQVEQETLEMPTQVAVVGVADNPQQLAEQVVLVL
jgi:hypothetical protein